MKAIGGTKEIELRLKFDALSCIFVTHEINHGSI
jgi:hypothetical protein